MLLVLVTCVVLLVVLLRRFRLVGRSRRAARRLFDDERDARALARAADAAAERGDWGTAVVERFRAIIRSLDERGLIEDYSEPFYPLSFHSLCLDKISTLRRVPPAT